ncbi:hypothetical protein GCM10018793_02630 [Streptomyces sulfonofaciens]|uniref:Uncharacterized protein n=1 Tax=Streptomyces sulfonofaciens TaxID=68272 RepID=A0A919FNP4_9ACTN|nr:hypothetical protein GCM10018793_02630 [Streptomyces sulfonofaciens]
MRGGSEFRGGGPGRDVLRDIAHGKGAQRSPTAARFQVGASARLRVGASARRPVVGPADPGCASGPSRDPGARTGTGPFAAGSSRPPGESFQCGECGECGEYEGNVVVGLKKAA